MNPIDSLFAKLRAETRTAIIPFITAGDPNLAPTLQLVKALAHRGAALLEIGCPYSDPSADGSVIQASYTRALQNGVRLDEIFARLKYQGAGGRSQESGIRSQATATAESCPQTPELRP